MICVKQKEYLVFDIKKYVAKKKKNRYSACMYKMFLFLGIIWAAGSVCAADIQWPNMANLKRYDAENIYERPYSLTENKVDTTKLYRNTGALVGVGVGTMAFLYTMPSSFTNWDSDDHKSPGSKWWDNVSREPVWDKDDFFLNYVTHPYAGAIYYMGARSAGANAGYSFLYSFVLSTFFWEYGIEAFAERPSIQDLIVTPVAGSLLGEGFFLAKRHIRDNDNQLWGSTCLGKTAVFLMDPITEVTDWLFDTSPKKQTVLFSSHPLISQHGGVGYGLQMQIRF